MTSSTSGVGMVPCNSWTWSLFLSDFRHFLPEWVTTGTTRYSQWEISGSLHRFGLWWIIILGHVQSWQFSYFLVLQFLNTCNGNLCILCVCILTQLHASTGALLDRSNKLYDIWLMMLNTEYQAQRLSHWHPRQAVEPGDLTLARSCS